MLTLPI